MRLYEVLSVDKTTGEKTLRSTDENYRGEDSFHSNVRANGKKYEGKLWMLLPQSKNTPRVITIKKTTQHSIEMGK